MQSPDSIFNAVSGPCQIRIAQTHESLIVLFKIKPRAPKTSSPDPRAWPLHPRAGQGGPNLAQGRPWSPSRPSWDRKNHFRKSVFFRHAFWKAFGTTFAQILSSKPSKIHPELLQIWFRLRTPFLLPFFLKNSCFFGLARKPRESIPTEPARAKSTSACFEFLQNPHRK